MINLFTAEWVHGSPDVLALFARRRVDQDAEGDPRNTSRSYRQPEDPGVPGTERKGKDRDN